MPKATKDITEGVAETPTEESAVAEPTVQEEPMMFSTDHATVIPETSNTVTEVPKEEPEAIIPPENVDDALKLDMATTHVSMEELHDKVDKAIEITQKQMENVTLSVEVPSSCKKPLRDMQLTDDQKMLLIRGGIENIIKTTKLDGGIMPAMISEDGSPLYTFTNFKQDTGATRVNKLLELDHRIVLEAFAYYKDNAVNPTHQGFLDLLEKASGKNGRLYNRVVCITLQ